MPDDDKLRKTDAELDAKIQASIQRILARVEKNRTVTERERQQRTEDPDR